MVQVVEHALAVAGITATLKLLIDPFGKTNLGPSLLNLDLPLLHVSCSPVPAIIAFSQRRMPTSRS